MQGRLRNFHGDVGAEGPHAVERAPVHDGRVARGHEHDHRFADSPPKAHHGGREDAWAGGGQDDPPGGLPGTGPAGEAGGGERFGHAGECVLADREDDGDDGETHGETDHQAIALIVSDAQSRLEPGSVAAAHGHTLEPGSRQGGQPHAHEQHRDHPEHLAPATKGVAEGQREPAPEGRDHYGEQKHHEGIDEDFHGHLFEEGRHHQTGEESQDDGRQGRHDLDGRLDGVLQPGGGELGRVEGAQHGQWEGEEHGIEGPLEGPEEQRNQTEFGLEIIRAPGALPDIFGFLIALVVRLPPEEAEADLGMGRVEGPEAQGAGRFVRMQDEVAPWG